MSKRALATVWLCSSAVGCLDHQLEETLVEQDGSLFIALQRDFEGFQGWEQFDIEPEQHVASGAETRVYIDTLPSVGAERFEVGTVIVKTVELGEPSGWEIHAMAKRGGNYNPNGAFDWEFFDLRIDPDTGLPVIRWRGEKPPDGEGYRPLSGGDDPDAMPLDCNLCHVQSDNDSVLSDPLQLDRP